MSPSTVWKRRAARVLLIDERSRVLLTNARDPDDDSLWWFAPGGSVEPGETIEQAARRELAEEVDGPNSYELRGPVWIRRNVHTFAGRPIDLEETYFVASVAAGEIREVRETGGGARYFEGWRWWSLEEVHASNGLFAPRDLRTLLPPILRNELPTEPISFED